MSWIHHEDFIAAVRWLIDRDDIEGAVNVAAPNPLPNAEFMQVLREACGVRLGLPAKKWMLEIGAVFMRTETELILKSRRVVPARLLEHGFKLGSTSQAPTAIAWSVRSMSVTPVRRMTGIDSVAGSDLSLVQVSHPSIPGMSTSRRIASG